MNVSACIFDLDGVIVDTAKYHFLSWKRLTDQLGINFTEHDNERLKGVSRLASLEIILEIGNKYFKDEEKQELAVRKNNWYVEYISRMTPSEILPGSVEFIRELRTAGIMTAIGSASKNTPVILQRVGIDDLFDAVSDGNIIMNAKPDPEVFLKAAAMIGINPGECVVFEDAVAGIRAGLNAGMACIGVGSSEILVEAHHVIGGLYEMNLEKLRTLAKDILL